MVGLRKRNNKVSFRLSNDEKHLFDELQKKTGLPQNRLIVNLLSSAVLTSTEVTAELKQLNINTARLAEQVKRIGINVNQLARVANSSGSISDISAIGTLNKILSALQSECDILWQYTNKSIQKVL